MAQTFDIRFGRFAGLAGLFEAPTNEYRWKGAGRLTIDASGVSIAARRGLMTMFARARARRIAANDLLEVYREGNALRLEFSTRESLRSVLPFWVDDRNAAAQIVTLLPTPHTVEIEDGGRTAGRYRFDRRLAANVLIGILVPGIAALLLQRTFSDERVAPDVDSAVLTPLPQVAAPASDLASGDPSGETASNVNAPFPPHGPPAASVPRSSTATPVLHDSKFDATRVSPSELASDAQPLAEPRTASADASTRISFPRASENGIFPIVQGDPRYAIARWQYGLFRDESSALHADYLAIRDAPTVAQLKALEARWYEVTSRIYNTPLFTGLDFLALREIELAISRSWRDYLSIHAEGLRTGNSLLIERALIHLEFTRHLETLLPQFVR